MKTSMLAFTVCLVFLVLQMPADGGKKKKSPGGSVVGPATAAKTKAAAPGNSKHRAAAALVQSSSANWNLNTGQKAALGKLLAQEPLTDGERQQLSDLLFNGQQAGLTQEDEAALSYLLTESRQNVSTEAIAVEADAPAGPLFLRVFNGTGERLKVWVQVLPETGRKPDLAKLPTLQFDLRQTGKAYDLMQQGQKIKATTVRVWAMSPTRSWTDHRDTDLHLTAPVNNSKTYVLTFSK